MVEGLGGCWAKLERAAELIAVIEQEEKAYLNSNPPPVRVTGGHEGSEWVFRAFGPDSAPTRFSVLAGEVVHHLRSSLDHVVWALAVKHLGQPSKKIQFPLCAKRSDYEKSVKNGIIKGIRHEATEVIESVQPYTSKEPHAAILYVVHQLDIADKHKLLLVTVAAAEMGEKITLGSDPTKARSSNQLTIVGLGSAKTVLVSPAGTRAFSVQYKERSPEATVDVAYKFLLAFREVTSVGAVPLVAGLKEMYAGVTHTVGLFRGLLS